MFNIHIPACPARTHASGSLWRLITEFISIKLLNSGQKGDLNLKGAFWHVMQTFVGSLIVIIAAVVIIIILHFTLTIN